MADPISTIKSISEIIKKYNDLELMKQIVSLQTEIFDLQMENLALKKEITGLNERGKMARKDPHGYYYKDGEDVPHCPKCWESDGKAITLPEATVSDTFGRNRICRVCKYRYVENPAPPRTGGRQLGGPWS
ncbi:MAG TPA: hypothetical protein VK728_05000 [Candidatus Sulfotelmatobacter sp.]|jgi:hypothetical protein|nr:hypothetical protein [Candidatus Sulfotelmatobacter sp.]